MIELRNGAMNMLRRYSARLTHVWTIERPDGAAPMQFTVHDQVLNRVGQLRCDPRPGLTISANRRAAGIGEKSIEISGLVGDGGITYADLHQGRLWGAVVTQRTCDWSFDFGPTTMLNQWHISDLTYDDRAWTFSLAGLTTRIKGKRGEVYSRLCQNELGVQNTLANSNILTTSACPVNISQYPRRVQSVPIVGIATTYAADPAKRVFYVEAVSATTGLTNAAHTQGDFASTYFRHGRVVFKTGALTGLQETIYGEVDQGDVARLAGVRGFRLMRPLPEVPAIGDTVDVYVGCDKNWQTCRDKFNALQGNVSTFPGTSGGFRGFPEMPGTDRATTYPPARGQ